MVNFNISWLTLIIWVRELIEGYWRKILHIDLTEHKTYVENISDDMVRLFIGGKGFAYYLMYKYIPSKINPLSPRSVLLFILGAFSGIILGSSKVTVAGKSPLTYLLTDSYSGDYFGPMMKKSGFDGLVIHGRSEESVYIWLKNEEIEIRDARNIWGLNVRQAIGTIRWETYEKASIACIGLAGENLVKIASIIFDSERAAGRGGLGAVMGSKNLKAVAVYGSLDVPVADPEKLNVFNTKIYDNFSTSPKTKELRKYGTTGGLIGSAKSSMSSSFNFSRPWIPEELASKISGEVVIRREVDEVPWYIHGAKCPIKCGKYVKGIYKGKEFYVKPEYESLAMLGAVTGTFDLDAVLYFIRLTNDLGLDSISTGNTIGWFLELAERGMLTKEDILGIGKIKGLAT